MTLAVDLTATFDAPGADRFVVDAEFGVEDGESLVVLGPSGSGKSLLLETIAGFHPHDRWVKNDGLDISDRPPEERNFGFVFQDYALFPHLTVRENVAFGERYRESNHDVDVLLDELDVGDIVERYPPTLSGGEKQRVALARALYVEPDVLLLDEPLSSLDVPTQETLREELAAVLADVTAVYVTHNRTTARTLADRIAVMDDGGIVQVGTPDEVFEEPATPFVARFTGSNCLSFESVPDAEMALDRPIPGNSSRFAIRPEHVVLNGTTSDLTATVQHVTREDATFRLSLALGDETLDAFTADPPAPGETVSVSFPPEYVVVL